jgi:hypothetical protein
MWIGAKRRLTPKLGAKMYTNADVQAKWCIGKGKAVRRSELLPDDLILWQNLSCPVCGRWHEETSAFMSETAMPSRRAAAVDALWYAICGQALAARYMFSSVRMCKKGEEA